MTKEPASEHVILSAGAGVMSVMLLYALATDVFHLERPGSRVLFLTTLLIGGVAAIIRFVRLRRLGAHVALVEPPAIPRRDRTGYLLWLVGAAILGAYSVRELLIGEFLVGATGCIASFSSMLLLAIGLLRPEQE